MKGKSGAFGSLGLSTIFGLAVIVVIAAGASCRYEKDFVTDKIELRLIDARTIQVPEASGLCYDSSSGRLLTVSDGNWDIVYFLNTNGEILDSLYLGEGNMDLEAISASPDGESFWVVEEGHRDIIQYDFNGHELRRVHLNFDGPENSGLEGVAIDFTDGVIYTVNEKNPPVIFKIDFSGNILAQRQVVYVADLSGLCIAPNDYPFDIIAISDESGMLITFSNSLDYTPFTTELGFRDGEGIAMKGDTLFIVTDDGRTTSKLYKFIIRLEN